ncbi:unnamed protein product [Rangifer tarandus platyrhynchus]|uniref:C2H2-type domain-containing protein n=1 Tax=Rangifer tarandus platyrhynchus TaxID=3082113 RepID=A0ABN8YMV8_RANTA|nr:unnamed protein product [Rangifer tarandus platyrhynchus]
MVISEEKNSARTVSERLQRQISQECRLFEINDPEDRLLRYWVSSLDDAVRHPSSQERGIREVNVIPKKTIAGEKGHGCKGREKFLSAEERSHRYENCGQSFKQKSEITEHQKIDNVKKTYECK